MSEQLEIFADARDVRMPKVEVMGLDNYDLSEIERDFVIPEFQRRWDRDHTNKIVRAIMTNKFYDNIITVYRHDGKYWLIDGQHRINALKICWAQYHLKRYSIILVIFPKENAHTIFRRNNLGKKLSITEMLNSMKDVNPELFRRLRRYCDSYRNQSKIGFSDLFNAFVFVEGKGGHSGVALLEDMLPRIKSEHIGAMEKVMSVLSQVEPEPNHNPIYRAPSLRSIYRLTYELSLNERQIGRMVAIIRASKEMTEMTHSSRHSALLAFYRVLLQNKSKWM